MGGPGCRLEGGVMIGLRGIGWDGVGWIHVAWDSDEFRAVGDTVMNVRGPVKFKEFVCRLMTDSREGMCCI